MTETPEPDANPTQASPPEADPQQDTPQKDPSEWVTGDEPMTGPQSSYLHTLSRQAGVDFNPSLSKAAASKLIDELQQRTGRGG